MRAFIFDFDGLIVDTEVAEFESWQEAYAQHGAELTLDVWADVVGSALGYFDPFAHLESLIGRPVDRENVGAKRRKRTLERIAKMPILPGIEMYIAEAKERKLLLGVASNSSRAWVEGHLGRIGLLHHFDVIRCRDDVVHPKPAPDLYQAVLRELGVAPDEAVAFEDSPHGVRAARAAGIFCVAIPSTLTQHLDFSHASLKLDSLADLSVEALFERVRSQRAI